jgi:iron complex outermembrane recepter protein
MLSRLQETGGPLARLRVTVCLGILQIAGASTAAAESTSDPEVVISSEAERSLLLDSASSTGTRLGLTVRETPAIVDILTQAQLHERGARTSIEALNNAPGVTAANVPGSPGITSLRGFSGNAISLLYDGMRQTTSTMIGRNVDSWSLERIEVLKGPASVLYGEGALAGAINLVPKQPRLGSTDASGLVSYGSFDTSRVAGDVNVPLGSTAALRALASALRTSGHIDRNDSEIAAGTLAFLWQPVDRLTFDLAVDAYRDDYETAYWGTPLVAASSAQRPSGIVRTTNGLVLDRALREANFNVADGLMDSRTTWSRSRIGWKINDTWKLTNELSYYDSERRWRNAEVYSFNAGTGLLSRSTVAIEHDHQFWLERATIFSDASLWGTRNRFALGVEIHANDFFNPRRFGSTTAVDPYAPVPGSFPQVDDSATFPGAGNRANFTTDIKVASVFVEEAANLTSRWLVIGGVRYEEIEVDRSIDDLNANSQLSFSRKYTPASWRVGSVYDVAPATQLFAQYSSAVAPVGTVLLLSQANARFSLTKGESVEVGLKSSFWDQRADLTLSGYWIRQDDIVTRDPLNSNITIQGGSQSSRGAEVSTSVSVTRALRIDASVAVLNARFDELIEAGGANRTGNTPPNVPENVAQLFAVYRLRDWPLTLSGGVRRSGYFFTDNANTIRVAGHTLADAAISYQAPFGEVTLRGRNLFDELYAEWAGASVTQMLLGARRSVDLTLTARF